MPPIRTDLHPRDCLTQTSNTLPTAAVMITHLFALVVRTVTPAAHYEICWYTEKNMVSCSCETENTTPRKKEPYTKVSEFRLQWVVCKACKPFQGLKSECRSQSEDIKVWRSKAGVKNRYRDIEAHFNNELSNAARVTRQINCQSYTKWRHLLTIPICRICVLFSHRVSSVCLGMSGFWQSINQTSIGYFVTCE